jgi:hypothetical protein
MGACAKVYPRIFVVGGLILCIFQHFRRLRFMRENPDGGWTLTETDGRTEEDLTG